MSQNYASAADFGSTTTSSTGATTTTYTNADGTTNTTGLSTFTISQTPTAVPYNLTGAHVGGAELLFRCNPQNTASFTLNSHDSTGAAHYNLSDYRAWNVNGLNTSGSTMASSIPEPQTYVMMLLGLLAVGYVVRRRNNDGIRSSFAM